MKRLFTFLTMIALTSVTFAACDEDNARPFNADDTHVVKVTGTVTDKYLGTPLAGLKVRSGNVETFIAEDGSYTLIREIEGMAMNMAIVGEVNIHNNEVWTYEHSENIIFTEADCVGECNVYLARTVDVELEAVMCVIND